MAHTSGNEFVKKASERLVAKKNPAGGDIFTAPTSEQSKSHPHHPHESSEAVLSLEPSYTSPVHHVPTPRPQPAPQELKHHMTRNEKLKFMLMRSLGNFFLLLSLYGVAATFGPALYYEVQFRVIQARGIQYSVAEPKTNPFPSVTTTTATAPSFADVIAGAQEQVLVPPDSNFSIVIPKIGATTKVWPNVDPLREDDFLPKLKSGVAHAKGSVFPGMQGNVYLFAHSTDNFWDVGRYNAIFYLLKDLKAADKISVFFENRRYNYVVDHTVIADPTDTDLLVKSQEVGKQQLILQTCWPPGTTWKRLFVIAKPV